MIIEHTSIDTDLENRIRVRPEQKQPPDAAYLTLDDLDDLVGHVAAAANHCTNARLRTRLYHLFDRLRQVEDTFTDEEAAAPLLPSLRAAGPELTAKQGQYLAFIFYYTKIHGRAPSEADFRSYFKVSPPAVHRMLLALEERGCIERKPGEARSARLLVARSDLPDLE
jgi:repressor LexA